MASILKVDKLDPQSGTALEIGTSGDTITVPSGATFNVAGTLQEGGSALVTGKIIQKVIVQSQDQATDILTNSTSFASVGIEVTITPTSASNHIDISFSSSMATGESSSEGSVKCYVDDANWDNDSVDANEWQVGYTYSSHEYSPMVWKGRYNPSSTSALKFTIYAKTSNASHMCRVVHNQSSYFMEAVEVEA